MAQDKSNHAIDGDPHNAVAFHIFGRWLGDHATIGHTEADLREAIGALNKTVFVMIDERQNYAVSTGGSAVINTESQERGMPLAGFLLPLPLKQLGDTSFCNDYALRFPYMCGSMANGIASVKLVKTATEFGLLGSFGAAGLSLTEIEQAVSKLSATLGPKPFCCNLIYTPNEKGHEDEVVALYLRHGIDIIEASAYMQITLPLVRYRVAGIRQNPAGQIITPNRIIAKASREEIATKWFSPPPEKLLSQLLSAGDITEQQARLAARIPMAQDLTVEADSGGHTDNRPAITLLPAVIALRDHLQEKFNYSVPLRVGAAGGIATPRSAAAAFSMGAAYIVTGTINQACIESGSSDIVRHMLSEAQQADVAMAPAVDMFEMGIKLQVLKRGTMFAMRGNKLYDIYRNYPSIEAIPQDQKQFLQNSVFRMPLTEVWEQTCDFFRQRDPMQIEKAKEDTKKKMALIFRWYLGLSSRWANTGEETRQTDYQIWCGPAMGAFNEWTKGSYLARPMARDIATVALNILYGAAVIARINSLAAQGLKLTGELINLSPLPRQDIELRIS